ncbi:MAG: hypothetical protein GF346_12555 [Candidatus Eisenbacteria bacterium]|nr:hypothetical protein [Candidatus Latescibacterota bacterium]MBD3303268.1 hypothetical protein [Candidatus Eisenbacteria bacterium]
MTKKHEILDLLGEGSLLVERRLNEGLLANDRAKYYLALIGLAHDQALSPRIEPNNLSLERMLSGIDDTWLDAVIPAARRVDDAIQIPRVGELVQRLFDETESMIGGVESCRRAEARDLRRRLDGLKEDLLERFDDRIDSTVVERLTSADRQGGEKLHLVVMDAHKAISRCGRQLAREKIGGIAVYGISEKDRTAVAAFAEGINRTAPLRFDHPGLGSTGTRIGDRLVLQNDIGQTDAHIFILSVEENAVDFTYTDVHRRRLQFFQSLLDPLSPEWKTQEMQRSEALPESSRFFLVRGIIRFPDRDELRRTLTAIGESLVFLIDWNKARRTLRTFVKGSDAIQILRTAALERVGHMAFLKLGGTELLYDTLGVVEPGSIRAGEPITSILGRRATIEFLQEILRITSRELLAGTSELVIRDRIKGLFLHRYRIRTRGPLEACRELAGLAVEEALTIRDMIRAVGRNDRAFLERNVRRTQRWEEEGDSILARFRKEARGRSRAARLLPAARRLEEQGDCLEEAAYLLLLLDPERTPPDVRFGLERLGELCVRAAQEGYKTVSAAQDLHHQDSSTIEEFSRRLDRLVAIAEGAKELRREVRGRLVGWETAPAGMLVLVADTAAELLGACENMARAGLTLHETILGDATGWSEEGA